MYIYQYKIYVYVNVIKDQKCIYICNNRVQLHKLQIQCSFIQNALNLTYTIENGKSLRTDLNMSSVVTLHLMTYCVNK